MNKAIDNKSVTIGAAIGDFFGSKYEKRRKVIQNCNDYGDKKSLALNKENQNEFAKLIKNKNKSNLIYKDVSFYVPDNENYSYIEHEAEEDQWNERKFEFTDDTMLTMAIAYTFNSDKYRNILEKTKDKRLKESELEKLYSELDEDVFVNFCKFSNRYERAYQDCGPSFWQTVGNVKNKSDDEIREYYKSKKEEVRKKGYTGYDTKSWGNGAAMRVSPCGYVANSLEEARVLAKMVTINTHENDLAIEGAQAIASVIFLSRMGLSKDTIKAYINYIYKKDNPFNVSKSDAETLASNYDMDKTTDEVIAAGYPYCIRCDLTVVQALRAFFESNSYISALDNALKLAGDTDTIGIMVASMASAYYGVPKDLINEAAKRLPEIKISIRQPIIDNETDNGPDNKDNLMTKINGQFDKNFSGGYRAFANKAWKLEQINRLVSDLNAHSNKNALKRQDLDKLIKSIDSDKEIIDERKVVPNINQINNVSENSELDFVNDDDNVTIYNDNGVSDLSDQYETKSDAKIKFSKLSQKDIDDDIDMYDDFLASFTDVESKPQKAKNNKNANKKYGASIFSKNKKDKTVLVKKPNNKNKERGIFGTIHKKSVGNKNTGIKQPDAEVK